MTVVRRSIRAMAPLKVREDDAAYMLHSCETITIFRKCSAVVSTGLEIRLPTEHIGLISGRAALVAECSIDTSVALISKKNRALAKNKE